MISNDNLGGSLITTFKFYSPSAILCLTVFLSWNNINDNCVKQLKITSY